MNTNNNKQHDEPQTAVDDVRRVREQIARQHQGDLKAHRQETNQIAAEYRAKLGLKLVQPPVREDGMVG
ncbi:MAG TPA: hypothetical protein VH370_16860 [Humisphaera sp.]|jgi:hypothetical protein|nr:hypothetical protein [Humisphaera sp.]